MLFTRVHFKGRKRKCCWDQLPPKKYLTFKTFSSCDNLFSDFSRHLIPTTFSFFGKFFFSIISSYKVWKRHFFTFWVFSVVVVMVINCKILFSKKHFRQISVTFWFSNLGDFLFKICIEVFATFMKFSSCYSSLQVGKFLRSNVVLSGHSDVIKK